MVGTKPRAGPIFVEGVASGGRASKRRGQQIVEQRQGEQKNEPRSETEADELLLDRQQRLRRSLSKFGVDIGLRHGVPFSEDQPASGGLMPAKNSQEISKPTQITKPNRLMT
jgi:hypothetical protein